MRICNLKKANRRHATTFGNQSTCSCEPNGSASLLGMWGLRSQGMVGWAPRGRLQDSSRAPWACRVGSPGSSLWMPGLLCAQGKDNSVYSVHQVRKGCPDGPLCVTCLSLNERKRVTCVCPGRLSHGAKPIPS